MILNWIGIFSNTKYPENNVKIWIKLYCWYWMCFFLLLSMWYFLNLSAIFFVCLGNSAQIQYLVLYVSVMNKFSNKSSLRINLSNMIEVWIELKRIWFECIKNDDFDENTFSNNICTRSISNHMDCFPLLCNENCGIVYLHSIIIYQIKVCLINLFKWTNFGR